MKINTSQKSRLANFKGPLERVEFFNYPSQKALKKYLLLSRKASVNAGGKRRFELTIDMVLSGMPSNSLPYTFVLIDSFSNGSQLLQALDGIEEKKKGLEIDAYTLILKPDASMKIVNKLRFLRPFFNMVFKIDRSKNFKAKVHLNQPERNPTSQTLELFRTLKQDEPFYNINLNKYFPPPEGQGSKEDYYAQFSKDTAKATGPKVLGLGAYPAASGKVVEIIEGDIDRSMNDDWDNFILVYYPRRLDYLHLVPNLPEDIILKRKNAYERGIQFPCSEPEWKT